MIKSLCFQSSPIGKLKVSTPPLLSPGLTHRQFLTPKTSLRLGRNITFDLTQI